MTSIEAVDVNNDIETDAAPMNTEVVEQNDTVVREPRTEMIEEPKAKATPRTNKQVEVVQCEKCGTSMNAKSSRFSHPKIVREHLLSYHQSIHKRIV